MARESYITRGFEATVRERWPEKSGELIVAMRARLSQLLVENAGASKELAMHLTSQILPAIAAYETLQQVVPKDEAFAIVHSYTTRNAQQSRTTFERALRIPGLYRVVPWLFQVGTHLAFGEAAGFAAEEHNAPGVWRIDMTRCPYHDFCVRYGSPELCTCFCDSDDIAYTDLHPGLVWHRTKTLGRGDDRCDFCLKVRGR